LLAECNTCTYDWDMLSCEDLKHRGVELPVDNYEFKFWEPRGALSSSSAKPDDGFYKRLTVERGKVLLFTHCENFYPERHCIEAVDRAELSEWLASRNEKKAASKRREQEEREAAPRNLSEAQDKGLKVGERMKTEQRVALVIGNSQYKASPLRNPVNDAKAMADTLGKLGFAVTSRYNLGQKEMKKAVKAFGKKLKKGGVGLFYYSGHGMQVNGTNYLIPVDAEVETEADVDIEAVPVGAVLAKMEGARNRLNIVILDACRNNPFATSFRSAAKGLSFMNAPIGTLIAYATAPGSIAADGDGKHGVYTSQLIRHMTEPGATIEQVFKKVRTAVKNDTGGSQVPWESTALEGEFCFTSPIDGDDVAAEPSKPMLLPVASGHEADVEMASSSGIDPELKHWAYVAGFMGLHLLLGDVSREDTVEQLRRAYTHLGLKGEEYESFLRVESPRIATQTFVRSTARRLVEARHGSELGFTLEFGYSFALVFASLVGQLDGESAGQPETALSMVGRWIPELAETAKKAHLPQEVLDALEAVRNQLGRSHTAQSAKKCVAILNAVFNKMLVTDEAVEFFR